MVTGVIYARYSSERQTEQSIEGQLTVCHKFAEENGINVVDTYIDRAVSGRSDNRADFQRMLADSKTAGWNYVIVYKGDRFARNRVESAVNKKTLRDNGVKLLSATENIPDAPEGIILESLLEGLAEYYSAELSQKVKRGQDESIKKRQFIGGHVLFGYDIVDKHFAINESEAEIVRQIFTDYSNGKTVKEIKADLDSACVFNKKGKPFTMNALFTMLGKEQYVGVKRFKGEVYDDMIPAILDTDLFNRVQAIREKNKHAPSRQKSEARYVLSGKLYCGECGELMTGDSCTNRSGVLYHYYKCFGKKRRTTDCTSAAIRKEYIEGAVFDACQRVLNNGFIQQVAEKAFKIHAEDTSSDLNVRRLEERLKEKQGELDHLVDAICKGLYTSATKQRLVALEKDVEDVKIAIEREKNKVSASLKVQDYVDFLNGFTGKADDQFKEEVIRFLINRIDVYRNKIRITFNYSPDDGKGKKRDYPIDDGEEIRISSILDHQSGIILTATIDFSGFAVWIPNTKGRV